MARQTAYYDREAGIVYVTVIPRRRRRRGGRHLVSEDRGWGLIDYEDRERGEVCGAEFWRPEEIFPADLLEALPAITLGRWERLRRSIRRRTERIRWMLWGRRRWERRANSPEGLAARAGLPDPHPWYRGLPGPPGESDERSDIAWRP